MNVGVDIGKGDVKVSYENELFSFPAIIGEGKDHALETKKKLDVTIGNQRYWVGELAKESFSQVKLFDKNHISEYTRILLLSALYQCPSSEFNVVVGLPIADFQKQKKDLSRLLKGEVKVNEKIIKVNNVSVFPQGTDRSNLTDKCHKKFGRHIDEVEQDIYEREKILYKNKKSGKEH